MEDKEYIYQEKHTLSFSEKNLRETAVEIATHTFPNEIPTFFALLISTLGVSEVITKNLPNITFIDYLVPATAISLAAAFYKGFTSYLKHIPAELAPEGELVQKLYRKKKIGWQYAIALEMINNRIETHEKSIARIVRGSEYLKPIKLNAPEYMNWAQERPERIIRLVKAVTTQFVHELPKYISGLDETVRPSEFKIQIDYIGELYREIRDFEAESHQIVPPKSFETAHELGHNWSSTLRKAASQFISILEQLKDLDKDSLKKGTANVPHTSVTIDPIGYLEDYLKELEIAAINHMRDIN